MTFRVTASDGPRRPPIPKQGNIYALSGGAQVIALDRDGERLWIAHSVRSLRRSRRTGAGRCLPWWMAIS